MRNPTNLVPGQVQVTSLSQYTRLKQPLSIGDVVSVSLAITRQRWRLFCGISLRAVAWLVIPVLGVTGMAVIASSSMRRSPGLAVLAVVVWLVASLYCFGKYLANAGLISRLVFNDLTRTEESVKDAARVTRSLTWSYLGASLIYLLIAVLVSFSLAFIFSLAFFLVLLTLGFLVGTIGGTGLLSPTSPMMGFLGVITIIVVLLLILGYFTGLVWILSRFFFSDVPLSVETKLGSIGTIGRSWALSEKSGFRLMTITTVGFLITLPINAIGQIITVIPFALDRSGGASAGLATGLSSLLNLLVTLGITLLTLGFWQSVKAVLYFDLLHSKEGLGLDLEN
ncbi:MAG: hypothetical protein NT070_13810 [Cyanobacteria bacterium]|nr:hypothetical protein [Cyanobacteriota bacterium]